MPYMIEFHIIFLGKRTFQFLVYFVGDYGQVTEGTEVTNGKKYQQLKRILDKRYFQHSVVLHLNSIQFKYLRKL